MNIIQIFVIKEEHGVKTIFGLETDGQVYSWTSDHKWRLWPNKPDDDLIKNQFRNPKIWREEGNGGGGGHNIGM